MRLWVMMFFFPSRPWLSLSLSLSLHLFLFFLSSPCVLLPSSSVHRGHCKTLAWVPSPQEAREAQGWLIAGFHHRLRERGLFKKLFPSHWDSCGLRIPGFSCNNKASHTAKSERCSKALHCFICRCAAMPHFAPYGWFLSSFLPLAACGSLRLKWFVITNNLHKMGDILTKIHTFLNIYSFVLISNWSETLFLFYT